MGIEELISIVIFLIFILYRFFAGGKKFDETKPGKERKPDARRGQESEKPETSLDDIFRELFDEEEPAPQPQPQPQQRQQKTAPKSQEKHYLDRDDDENTVTPEDYGSWAEEVTEAEKKLKKIEEDMAEDPLVIQEKEAFSSKVYQSDEERGDSQGGDVDIRMAVIHQAILNRPKY